MHALSHASAGVSRTAIVFTAFVSLLMPAQAMSMDINSLSVTLGQREGRWWDSNL
jgi:hypothetical protein